MVSKGRQAVRTNLRPITRNAPTREPYDYVLIVCEGEKTEPNYFKSMVKIHRLSSANVVVRPSTGSDPVSVVRFGLTELENKKYDKVFCIFDRDGHANYDEALKIVSKYNLSYPRKLTAITSWPCFEFWLLLHFTFSSAPFEKTAAKSSCDMVLSRLRSYFPTYAKGGAETYEDLRCYLDTAMKNSVRLSKQNKDSQFVNPSTKVHELVDYLIKLRPNS
jgi:hypothetical protein